MSFLDSVSKLVSNLTGKATATSAPKPTATPTQAPTQATSVASAPKVTANAPQMSSDDILYKNAYDAMNNAKTQDEINSARQIVGSLKGTAGEHGMGEFSKQLDMKQQGLANPAFNQQTEQDKMAEFLKQQSQAYQAQQKAILDGQLAQQIAQLESAYAQAVADGNISVRQAEQDFIAKKADLEKQAYQDTQKTSLYGQDMGIQNSQQQVGLMQGDMARSASLNNQNKTTRDQRVADVRDRLSAITKQKNLDIANANAQYSSGILKTNSEASMNYSNNMFGMLKDSYNANLQQSFTEKNMGKQQEFDLMKMATQQGYTLENMEKEFGFNMKELQESSRLRIGEMTKQHGFDIEKMGIQLENDIKMENIQYGHQSSLQGQAHANAMAQASANFKRQAQLIQQEADAEKNKLASAYLDKNSTEYKIRMAQIDEATQIKTADIYATTKAEAKIKATLTDPALNKPVGMPKDKGDLINKLTGYDKQMNEYINYQKAYSRYQDLLK